jgi:hypothetical protein
VGEVENGVEGEADLSDLVGKGVFRRWLDTPGEFAQVRVDPESGTLSWPGGLDVAPDRLYSEVLRSQNGVEVTWGTPATPVPFPHSTAPPPPPSSVP